MVGDEFSELLGRLKERSGLSYGVLGKRLHTSASTLHRYVNGDAVPTDYAPVERFARACRATPGELVELHRQWILADARRREQRASAPAAETTETGTGAEGGGGTETASGTDAPEAGADGNPGANGDSSTDDGPGRGGNSGADGDFEPEGDSGADGGSDRLGGGVPPAEESVVRRRRHVVFAGAAVVAAVVSAALVVSLVPGKGDDDRGEQRSVGAAASASGGGRPSASPSAGSGSPSPSASRGGKPTASVSATRSGGVGAAPEAGAQDGATAPTVAVNPYKWEDQCSQHYLVNRQPEQVPPPPSEPDARGWVGALGGVPGGEQMLALTVQGTGKATVVLEALHVRVVDKSAPLAWNDFTMGVGCGGGVRTAAFGVDLDAGRPALSPKNGQRDFPYKVSESDPEVFYVFADARAHNVSWYLELDWSSGDRQGTVRVDDRGRPFRTSGNVGRPAYTYPLGSSEWGRDEVDPDIPG
ncbi:helix-turn-helix transcriptional regulator [Streptomyces sp. SLBN-31]|uniref:helix-turn-helix domain-containing protein n=1 Tax=Streptomyces sp. SLBN-31 TaxID=2768444 RepID=UPI0011738446|nr:helix-turn-helix transcriptional regulator [Streptomyces sp. SLBN-31]TQJ75335.1 helix-turn-helix protein [Streptomyces sp. SLBN-31]